MQQFLALMSIVYQQTNKQIFCKIHQINMQIHIRIYFRLVGEDVYVHYLFILK